MIVKWKKMKFLSKRTVLFFKRTVKKSQQTAFLCSSFEKTHTSLFFYNFPHKNAYNLKAIYSLHGERKKNMGENK